MTGFVVNLCVFALVVLIVGLVCVVVSCLSERETESE
jgi:hypothetical protein